MLCKISDLVHNHRYQWQHVDLVMACRQEGMIPCDCLIKVDPCRGNLKSSKWKKVRHLRNVHCFWIVVRKSGCERKVEKGKTLVEVWGDEEDGM